MSAYGTDLAHVHDAGFTDFATGSAPYLLGHLRRAGIRSGLVVDLGCGSGAWARSLTRAGYEVLGIDQSRAMIALARRHAPAARFRVGSFLKASLPECGAVTALGEVFNYTFDRANTEHGLFGFFRRVHEALRPGGLFVFDGAGPGRLPATAPRRSFTEGDGWVVLVDRDEDIDLRVLTRRIVTFRRLG